MVAPFDDEVNSLLIVAFACRNLKADVHFISTVHGKRGMVAIELFDQPHNCNGSRLKTGVLAFDAVFGLR